MNEGKRRAEDVELDGRAGVMALNAWCIAPSQDCNDVRAAIRTYIAEADLIERPSTVEEWAALVPASAWENIDKEYTKLLCHPADDCSFLSTVYLAIPRPSPAKLTDEEIDARAKDAAHKEGDLRNARNAIGTTAAIIDAYLAERARLEKERGE